MIDGPLSGGVPKAVELFALDDISDLSEYGIGSANNGGGSDGEEFTFPGGSVSAKEYITVASEDVGFLDYFGSSPTYTSNAASINGDDAIELFFNDAVVDVYGDINVDGTGQPWEYSDGWAYRADGKCPSTQFDTNDWTISGKDVLDGCVLNDNCASTFMLGTFSILVSISRLLKLSKIELLS